MSTVKNRKALSARFHQGVGIGKKVLNSAVPGKDFVEEVELHDIGVYVRAKDNEGKITEDVVSYSNVLTVRLAPESDDAPVKTTPKK